MELSPRIIQWLLEVNPLRGKTTGRVRKGDLFPLPTSRSQLGGLFPQMSVDELSWMVAITISLNSIWGEEIFSDRPVSKVASQCLELISKDIERVSGLSGKLEDFNWREFFSTRTIDYKGDEVRSAKAFRWQNISPALPPEIGRVPLAEVCTHKGLGATWSTSTCTSSPRNNGTSRGPLGSWSPMRTGLRCALG